MKLSITTIILVINVAAAFVPSTPTFLGRGVAVTSGCQTTLYAEPREEEGLDLNLEEMFDMYVRMLS